METCSAGSFSHVIGGGPLRAIPSRISSQSIVMHLSRALQRSHHSATDQPLIARRTSASFGLIQAHLSPCPGGRKGMSITRPSPSRAGNRIGDTTGPGSALKDSPLPKALYFSNHGLCLQTHWCGNQGRGMQQEDRKDADTFLDRDSPPSGASTDMDQENTSSKGGGLNSWAVPVGLLLFLATSSLPIPPLGLPPPSAYAAQQFTDMPALRGKDYGKTAMRYPDYVLTDSGLQYKDLREGSGPIPKEGQTVVIDWDGFTIGYYGRIFEARNKTKGGSFEGNNKEFYRFKVGGNKVIPAFEEAVATMKLGGVRRIVVPPEIGYPENNMDLKGPKPITFSGQRALDFVLRNQGMIDKTLLFDIELVRID